MLERKARSILNKLTPQKFETLKEQFNGLTIDTEEKLTACMNLIFEKAIDEPGFSVAYARMCLDLQKKEVANAEGKVNFRKLLITRCQKEFEKVRAAALPIEWLGQTDVYRQTLSLSIRITSRAWTLRASRRSSRLPRTKRSGKKFRLCSRSRSRKRAGGL